ncbi:NTP transferase domain-containing protein [Rhodococcus erythropolis]
MLVHALMAGGLGSRLYGSNGGSKPLEEVAPRRVLMDYVLDEGIQLDPDMYVIAIRKNGQPVVDHLKSRLRRKVISVQQKGPGTGGAVASILAGSPEGATIFLTTCDLCGERGAIADAFRKVDEVLNSTEPVCVIAVSPWHPSDLTPIFVNTANLLSSKPEKVTRYGKDIAPSSFAFSGARIFNDSFAKLLTAILKDLPGAPTDTELMKHAVEDGAHVLAVLTPSVFDVDDRAALQIAREFYQFRS